MADHAGLAFQMAGLAASIIDPSLHRVVGGEKSLVLSMPQAVLMGKMLLEASQALNALSSEEFDEEAGVSYKWLTGELQALAVEHT